MTKMIERWFPCADISANSASGWGSGNQERALFTWFAARPTAQAKAAVLCSLLPWPDDPAEQQRLQELVRHAMRGRHDKSDELRQEILRDNGSSATIIDPFSGRGIIPLIAARLGIAARAVDYSPVAVLASELLTDYPYRDWSTEPALPFTSPSPEGLIDTRPRLLADIERFLAEVNRKHRLAMDHLYPSPDGVRPRGYLWAVTLPCQECGRRFPLVASYELRRASTKSSRKGAAPFIDAGQSFYIDTDAKSGTFTPVVHDGPPERPPTLASSIGADGKRAKGKSAVCPFCGHVHPLATHQRLAQQGLGRDTLLIVVTPDARLGRTFRTPTPDELAAVTTARTELRDEPAFNPGLPAVPDEPIPENNGATIRPQLYGANAYGDLMCDRQTLSFVRLCRAIQESDQELAHAGVSGDYRRALSGYATAVLVRMLRFSTRGARLRTSPGGMVIDLFTEGTISFSYDFFEVGLSDGPGSWPAMSASGYTTLSGLFDDLADGQPAQVQRGSATALPYRDATMSAVVTDPPYDSMVYYSDSSDLFYVWLKRALVDIAPEVALVAADSGLQDKTEEIIVKEHGRAPGEHRTREHYDNKIAAAFAEMRRVVAPGGVVTIVFGHGEPEVWQRLLHSIEQAGLVMTSSWPANTESGGQQGKANITTTLTMSCRPAPTRRPPGRKGSVENAIKDEIRTRYPDWERWGLAPADMLMAAAGPAMEVVGRYSEVLDARGNPVDIYTFLPLARAAVQAAMAVEIDHQPLDSFDARTRFALWWVRLYGRNVQPKSELRWQTLASDLETEQVRDLIRDSGKGVRFTLSSQFTAKLTSESSTIDVALTLAKVSESGLDAMGQALADAGREPDDLHLWSTISFLVDRLPDSDADAVALARVLRTRGTISTAVAAAGDAAARVRAADAQLKLI